MAREFFSKWQASNRSILSLRIASTTANLKSYLFGSGIESIMCLLALPSYFKDEKLAYCRDYGEPYWDQFRRTYEMVDNQYDNIQLLTRDGRFPFWWAQLYNGADFLQRWCELCQVWLARCVLPCTHATQLQVWNNRFRGEVNKYKLGKIGFIS